MTLVKVHKPIGMVPKLREPLPPPLIISPFRGEERKEGKI
jgi:hypothetical protein